MAESRPAFRHVAMQGPVVPAAQWRRLEHPMCPFRSRFQPGACSTKERRGWLSAAVPAASTAFLQLLMIRRRVRFHRGRSKVTARLAAPNESSLFPVCDVNGLFLEVLGGSGSDTAPSRPVTLLLIHGSYHAAWCWEPHFLDYFRQLGYRTYALSLRWQGQCKAAAEFPDVAGTLEEHASDVAQFIKHLKVSHGQPVVVLGHSFGGLIVQKAVAEIFAAEKEAIAGMALLSSVPPSGNDGLVWRYVFSDPWLAARITWGFATRAFERDVELCRDLFFEKDMPLAKVEGHMQQMRLGCPAKTRLLDLRELRRSLPVSAASPEGKLPVFVFGGSCDAIVDLPALEETAKAHGSDAPTVLPGLAHDAMLSSEWSKAADALQQWIEAKVLS